MKVRHRNSAALIAAAAVGMLVALPLGLPLCHAADGQSVVRVGAGGYLTTVPKPCKPLPESISKTGDLKGPTITNQWWSSLVWQKYSQNMFAHPAVVRCGAKGLMMAYPGSRVHGNKTGIFGSADLNKGDLQIGHSAVASFPRADCGGYSDGFVTAVFTAEQASLRATFGHGSPFVYCMYQGGTARITFTNTPQIWAGQASDSTLGVTVNGHHYGLFGASGSSWNGHGSASVTNLSQGQPHFSIAVLPDNQPATLRFFATYAHAHVTDSRLQ